jgi:hypothetical protein
MMWRESNGRSEERIRLIVYGRPPVWWPRHIQIES